MNKFALFSDVRLGYTYPLRLLLFFLISFLCLLAGAICVGAVTHGGMTTLTLRIATVVQDVVVFVLPSVFIAMKVADPPASLLAVDRWGGARMLILAMLTILFSIPLMNALVAWNESITLPDSLSDLELWLKRKEESAQGSVKILLGGVSIGDLVVSMLIVSVLAAFSEELFFRGAMQRLLASGPLSPHAAIWLTAFIFSAFHMQFYGFFPRLLLGAYFGYLLWWTRSVWIPVIIHMVNNGIVVYAMWRGRVTEMSGGSVADTNSNIQPDSLWWIIFSVVLTTVVIYVMHREAVKNNLEKV